MKRNFILLACNLVTTIILLVLYTLYISSDEDGLDSLDSSNRKINKNFEKYFETKVQVDNKHNTTKTMLDKNIYDGKKMENQKIPTISTKMFLSM